MKRVRVKICGLTRARDVENAVESGADMLGFVFAHGPRRLPMGRAAELAARVPPGIVRVGLFLDPGADRVRAVLDAVSLDLLQFHGSEENRFCRSFRKPFIKAISMGPGSRTVGLAEDYPDAQGLLYDSHSPGGRGGTGEVFDWSLLSRGVKPAWLAGGLTPENVGTAIELVRPWAVDVSSGVEDSPGIKNQARVRAFIMAVRAASNAYIGKPLARKT